MSARSWLGAACWSACLRLAVRRKKLLPEAVILLPLHEVDAPVRAGAGCPCCRASVAEPPLREQRIPCVSVQMVTPVPEKRRIGIPRGCCAGSGVRQMIGQPRFGRLFRPSGGLAGLTLSPSSCVAPVSIVLTRDSPARGRRNQRSRSSSYARTEAGMLEGLLPILGLHRGNQSEGEGKDHHLDGLADGQRWTDC